MPWNYSDGGLTHEQMMENADIIISAFRSMGYADAAIAAILGNMENESGLSPTRHEVGGFGGYGLVQWTPASKLNEFCAKLGLSNPDNGDSQLTVVDANIMGKSGCGSWYSTAGFIRPYYPSGASADMIGLKPNEFKTNSKGWDPGKLAIALLACYLRGSYTPSVNHYQKRISDARKWHEYMNGKVTNPWIPNPMNPPTSEDENQYGTSPKPKYHKRRRNIIPCIYLYIRNIRG